MAKQTMLGEFMAGRVGLVKATRVAAFIIAWGIYSDKTEGPHTLDGYTAYWGQSLSTTYRERDLFRLCFPDEKVPDRIWAKVSTRFPFDRGARERDVNAVRLLTVEGWWSGRGRDG